MKLLRLLCVLPIRFYRRYITRFTPPTCRFRPSCSAYGEEAILGHGIVKGTLLIVWRILRCQPFHPGGFDPVPERGRWKSTVAPPSTTDEEGKHTVRDSSPTPSSRPPDGENGEREEAS